MLYIYTQEYYSVIKWNELLIQQYGWISKTLDRVKESDTKEYVLYNSIYVTSRADKLIHGDRNQNMIAYLGREIDWRRT